MSQTITAEITLVPARDRFVPIILDAVQALKDRPALHVIGDHVASRVTGPGAEILAALSDLFARAAASGAHVVFFADLQANGAPLGLDLPASGHAVISRLALAQEEPVLIDVLVPFGLQPEPGAPSHKLDGDIATIFTAASRALDAALAQGLRPRLRLTLTANLPGPEDYR